MIIEINVLNGADKQISNSLKNLGCEIENACGVPTEEITAVNEDGYKDGGLVIGLTISGLVLSGISTFVSVLTYWQNRQAEMNERYSISLSINNNIYTIENMTSKSFKSILENDLKKLEEGKEKLKLQINKHSNV